MDDGTVLANTGGLSGSMVRAHSFVMPVSGAHLIDDLGAHWAPAADGRYGPLGFGGSLDADGDGADDVFVSTYDQVRGTNHIYAAAPTSLDRPVLEVWASGQGSMVFPFAAGDYDGDGFEDLALYASGRFSVHPGPFIGAVDPAGSIAELSYINWIYPPMAHGDTDGDGLDELAGAYEYGAWLLQGGETGALQVHDEGFVRRKWSPWGPNEPDIEVRALTDLDEDGYADLITAAPRDKTADGREQPGFVWVEHGPVQGEAFLEAAADLTLVGWSDPTTVELDRQTAFGAAIATADFDADGSTDLAIGAPYGEAHGGVFIYLAPAAGTYEIGDADATVRGPAAPRTGFGSALQAQDVDGDGAADLLVEAPWDAGAESAALYLFLGSSLF